MGDDVLRFEQHQDRSDDDDLVRCARCGKRIPAASARCPACRVHFHGEAQDFYHPSEHDRGNARKVPWIVAVALLLVIALVVGALGLR